MPDLVQLLLSYSDSCRSELNGFQGVFDLEQSSFGGECTVGISVLSDVDHGCASLLDAAIWTGVSNCDLACFVHLPYSDLAMNILSRAVK